jgi:hypothetical protein
MKVEPINSTFLNSSNNPLTSDRWERYLRNHEYLPKEKKEPQKDILEESTEPPDEHLIGWA